MKVGGEGVTQAAEAHFDSGLFCAESVVLAVAERMGIRSPLLPKIATGFCGGMARTSNMCGALTGGIIAVGLACGRETGDHSPNPAYAGVQRLIAEFEAQFGSSNCATLLGCDLGTEDGRRTFQERNLWDRCRVFTGWAAGKASEIAAAGTTPPPSSRGSRQCSPSSPWF